MRTAALVLVATLAAGSADALRFTLDFDFANGTVITGPGGVGSGVLDAIEIGNPSNVLGQVNVSAFLPGGADAYGVVFDTSVTSNSDADLQNAPFTAGPQTVTGITSPVGSDQKVMIVQNTGANPAGCAAGLCTTPNDNASGGRLFFDFTPLSTGGITALEIPLFEITRGEQVNLLLSDNSVLALDDTRLGQGIGDDASGLVDVAAFIGGYSAAVNPTNVIGLELIFTNSAAIGLQQFTGELTPPAPIPVPAALPLALAGLGALAALRRRAAATA